MSKKILGNVVGVPNPKSDWNQNDETKADAILNKPTKLSQFENDIGYLTEHQDISGKADKSHTHKSTDVVFLMEDGSVDYTLQDELNMLSDNIGYLYSGKADNTVTVELTDNMGIESVTETDTVANILQKVYSETRNHSVLFNQDMYPMISDLQSNKISKTQISTYDSSAFTFRFENTHNREYRLAEATNISFTFGDGEYELDYTSGLSFDSGATPTAIDYTDSGILNWVGTDCTTSNGLSIFQPSANTHYDIVFYFNGRQFIGLVNGFVSSIEWQGALPRNEAV
jgi:hypothetical protein